MTFIEFCQAVSGNKSLNHNKLWLKLAVILYFVVIYAVSKRIIICDIICQGGGDIFH